MEGVAEPVVMRVDKVVSYPVTSLKLCWKFPVLLTLKGHVRGNKFRTIKLPYFPPETESKLIFHIHPLKGQKNGKPPPKTFVQVRGHELARKKSLVVTLGQEKRRFGVEPPSNVPSYFRE